MLQARLPAEKEKAIYSAESLIGHLHHACKFAPQVRTFPHRMIYVLYAFQRDDHPIRLKQEFRLYLTWWRNLLQK